MNRNAQEQRVNGLVDEIRDAQNQIIDALENLKAVARRMNDSRLDRIIIPAIECVITEDHEWLDSSSNLDDVIRSLQIRDDECDEEYGVDIDMS